MLLLLFVLNEELSLIFPDAVNCYTFDESTVGCCCCKECGQYGVVVVKIVFVELFLRTSDGSVVVGITLCPDPDDECWIKFRLLVILDVEGTVVVVVDEDDDDDAVILVELIPDPGV